MRIKFDSFIVSFAFLWLPLVSLGHYALATLFGWEYDPASMAPILGVILATSIYKGFYRNRYSGVLEITDTNDDNRLFMLNIMEDPNIWTNRSELIMRIENHKQVHNSP